MEGSRVSSYLDVLQNQIDNSSTPIIESTPIDSSKSRSRILSLFSKNIRK